MTVVVGVLRITSGVLWLVDELARWQGHANMMERIGVKLRDTAENGRVELTIIPQ